MSIQTVKKIAATLALSAMILPMASVAETYKSASFGFAGKEVVDLVDVSSLKVEGESAVLYCKADINTQGQATSASCFDKQGNTELESQANSALTKLAFTPAEVDGTAVPVRMVFRISFAKTADEVSASMIPNLGSMQARYGRDYVAPQERLDVSDWYQKYNENSWVNGAEFLSEGPLSRVAATVSEDGKPSMVRTLDTERAFKRDANVVKAALKRSRFIPGFVDGKPVPMGYLAVVNYNNSDEMVGSR